MFVDRDLSRRLERAEGFACMEFAMARKRLDDASDAAWSTDGERFVVFDGAQSPLTQAFGVTDDLDAVEAFFGSRRAPVNLEVSPFAGVPFLGDLVARGYRPIELSTVLFRSVTASSDRQRARVVTNDEMATFADVNARGWSHEHPELLEFLAGVGRVSAARAQSTSFLAEIDGEPAAAAQLCHHEGVALFAGASTLPEFRRRGLQSALLEARMQWAAEHGCDLAMMVTEVGSASQRNAERQGFRIAYTRTKWQRA